MCDETVQDSRVIGGLEMDLVSHDARKFFGLLLKKNGYVLEQIFSPFIVHTTPKHEELKEICRTKRAGSDAGASGSGAITMHHSHQRRRTWGTDSPRQSCLQACAFQTSLRQQI
jgi:hypothetical protein